MNNTEQKAKTSPQKWAFYMPSPPSAVSRVHYLYNDNGSLASATFQFESGGDTPGAWIVQDDRDQSVRGEAQSYHGKV